MRDVPNNSCDGDYQGPEFVLILLTINLRDNNLNLYSKSSPCILKLSYMMLSFETVGFQTHKLLPLLCRPANLKQELISTGSEEHEHVYHCCSF